MSRLTVAARVLPDGSRLHRPGRDTWALIELVKAGPKGCTPLELLVPAGVGDVHALRHGHGLAIETIHEAHRRRISRNGCTLRAQHSVLEIISGTMNWKGWRHEGVFQSIAGSVAI